MDKACDVCGKEWPDTLEYFRPTGTGKPRATCRECDRAADRQRWHSKVDPLALVPSNAEQFYDSTRGLYNLTALWRAAGCPRSKRPSFWFNTEQYKDFVAELNVTIGNVLSDPGRSGGTWAHWQVAVEYARYLSPAFAIQWNEYAAAYLRGDQRDTAIVTPAPSQPDAIEQIRTGLMTLLGPTVEQLFTNAFDRVVSERFGPMPQQVAETHEAVRGATVIEREVVRETTIEWMSNGWCYLFVSCDGQRMAIGETNKATPERRLFDGDYNGGKDGAARWQMLHAFQTDDRKSVEAMLHRLVRQAGARSIPNTRGTFERDERVIADFCQLPKKIHAEHLRRYVEQARLFEPPMFML